MAIRSDITAAKELFVGTDRPLRFEVLDADGIPVDVTGYALQWAMRQRAEDPDPPLILKTTGGGGITVTGTYNATRASNTQRVIVALEDTDTDGQVPQTYQHALKRTDPGSEDVLAYGKCVLLQAATH